MEHCPCMALLLYYTSNSREIGKHSKFAMAAISFRLLVVILLCFSQLFFFSNAVPTTRTISLQHKPQVHGVIPTNNHMANAGKKWNVMVMKKMRRMDVELNDYPGSGPNNRHTPRAQVARSCVDC